MRKHADFNDLTQEGKTAIKIKIAYERLQPYFQFDIYNLRISFAAQCLVDFAANNTLFGNKAFNAEYKTQWASGATLWVNETEGGFYYFTVENNGTINASWENK